MHPNPLVGCVLVRDDRIVGEGWHREFGGPHAEVEALTAAGEAARGATAYVSLEPCGHHGKTPPCSLALREAGVSRVVFGAADPGVGAGGGRALRDAGVEVDGPRLTPAEARRENPAFFAAQAGRGHLTLKLALSLDGRIAAAPGERTPVTGPAAAAWVHRLRAGFDAILVGARTALVDDPLLTVRGDITPRIPPARVVLDPGATLPPGAALLRRDLPGRVLVMVAEDAPEGPRRALEEAGAEVVPVPGASATGWAGGGGAPGGGLLPGSSGGPSGAPSDGLPLRAVRDALLARGFWSLLCEGGGRLAAGLVQGGLVDRMHVLVAPRVLGAGGVPGFPAPPSSPGQQDGGPEGGRGGPGIGSPAVPPGRWIRACDPGVLGEDVLMTWDREEDD